MKKITLIALIVITALLQSCGSSRKFIKNDPCTEYALLAPTKRAAGTGTDYQETTATNLATNDARSKLASQLHALIDDQVKEYTTRTNIYTNSDKKTKKANEGKNIYERSLAIWTTEVVKNSYPVKHAHYIEKNGDHTIYICLELQKPANELAKDFTETVFKESLTPEQKEQFRNDEQQFLEDMRKRFEGKK